MKKVVIALVALMVLPALYLLFWPTGMDPVAWKVKPAPALEGRYAVNNRLADVQWLAQGAGHGPEDVDIDAEGRIYAGYHDGRILRFSATGEEQELFADTEGRPLGLDFAPDGSLVVADAIKGLLAIRKDGTIRVLSTEADGLPYAFTDDLDVASDGSIYFSDASSKWEYGEHIQDILEHGGHGRLLRYQPIAGVAEVLMDDLQFANGVALAKDESYVLVNETGSYRVLRYWLKGDRAGESEVFIDNLPGIPDGISTGEDFHWLALYAPRVEQIDRASDKPFLRKLAYRLPEFMREEIGHYAMVLALDSKGDVIHNLQDPSPNSYAPITSVEERNGQLYLGSLIRDAIGRIDAPPRPVYLEPDVSSDISEQKPAKTDTESEPETEPETEAPATGPVPTAVPEAESAQPQGTDETQPPAVESELEVIEEDGGDDVPKQRSETEQSPPVSKEASESDEGETQKVTPDDEHSAALEGGNS